MQYMGGKSRIAKQIAAEIDKIRRPGQLVWDAFCGGLSVSRALRENGPVLSSDSNQALISLYQALSQGWQPPTDMTEDEYKAAKNLPDSNPLKAFAGFACSFGGKWFGGFSRPRPKYAKPIAGAAKKAKLDGQLGPFECIDFLTATPKPFAGIIYCDCPYAGTTSYDGTETFNHDLFTVRVDEWSRFTDVFVSEYSFPLGSVVWESKSLTGVNSGMSGKAKEATERLFYIPKSS